MSFGVFEIFLTKTLDLAKILVIGDGGVGKTSLITRFT
jgi:GTPase SAR1 family protein